jgi:hypothetical protein
MSNDFTTACPPACAKTQSKGVADRLANLQASYDGLVQKLAEANAALEVELFV